MSKKAELQAALTATEGATDSVADAEGAESYPEIDSELQIEGFYQYLNTFPESIPDCITWLRDNYYEEESAMLLKRYNSIILKKDSYDELLKFQNFIVGNSVEWRDFFSNAESSLVLHVLNNLFDSNTVPKILSPINKWKLIHYAAKYHNINVIKKVVELGGDPNDKTKFGFKPLNTASKYNNSVEIVRYLVNKCGCDVNTTTNNDYTPLLGACHNDKDSDGNILEELVKLGAKINVITNKKSNALHLCSTKTSRSAKLNWLLNNTSIKSLINQKNKCGSTPLLLAAKNHNCVAVRLLLDHGALPNIKNNHGETALNALCKTVKNSEFITLNIVDDLIESGNKLNISDIDNKNILHSLCENGSHHLLEYLLAKHPTLKDELFTFDDDQCRPIDLAAKSGRWPCVHICLDYMRTYNYTLDILFAQ
uniref:Uncharacterized protein n=1 Tax=viral metagenome TaxID=1070528 RepID=A0A6C0CKD8_9ZZZZ